MARGCAWMILTLQACNRPLLEIGADRDRARRWAVHNPIRGVGCARSAQVRCVFNMGGERWQLLRSSQGSADAQAAGRGTQGSGNTEAKGDRRQGGCHTQEKQEGLGQQSFGYATVLALCLLALVSSSAGFRRHPPRAADGRDQEGPRARNPVRSQASFGL